MTSDAPAVFSLSLVMPERAMSPHPRQTARSPLHYYGLKYASAALHDIRFTCAGRYLRAGTVGQTSVYLYAVSRINCYRRPGRCILNNYAASRCIHLHICRGINGNLPATGKIALHDIEEVRPYVGKAVIYRRSFGNIKDTGYLIHRFKAVVIAYGGSCGKAVYFRKGGTIAEARLSQQ